MPDRSLLFFYGLVFAAVIYFIVKFRKEITKKDGLINIASSLVIAIAIMFLLNSDLSATGILIAIFSFLAAGFIFLCVAILLKDVYSTKKYTLTAIKRIKTENSIDLKDMPEFKSGIFCYKKSWYAIYSPSLKYRPFRDAGLFGDIAGSGFVVFYHGCVDPCFGEVKLYPARSDPLSARRHVCCNYVPFLHPIAICCATGCKR
ncbi:TPA: hypothetical protein ACQVLH_005592 [Serratia marcescens]